MKKQFLIGILFFMFAFVSDANQRVEVDIGTAIECEALHVDQLAIIDNVNVFIENENFLITKTEVEVEISPGVLSILCDENYRKQCIKKQIKTVTSTISDYIDKVKQFGNDAKSAMVNCFTSYTLDVNLSSICGIFSEVGDRYTTPNGVNDSNEGQVLTSYPYLLTYNMVSKIKLNNIYRKSPSP